MLMLYSTFASRYGDGLIDAYGPMPTPLRSAAQQATRSSTSVRRLSIGTRSFAMCVRPGGRPTIGIYSLEGSVRQGFLNRLAESGWPAANPQPNLIR